MKEIGLKLKEKREELNLKLEDVSEKSKISIDKLQNIEEGNVEYFRSNLSYLKYYIRFYYNELGLDYNEVRDQLNDIVNSYTEEISLEKIAEMNKMQENINRRVSSKTKKNKVKVEKKKFDFNFILMVLVIIVAVCSLFYGGLKLIQSGIFTNEKNNDNPDEIVVTVENTPTTTIEVEDTETVKPVSKVTVSEIDFKNYSIIDYIEGEEISLKVFFASDTWTRLSLDGIQVESPASTIYKKDESIELLVTAKKDMIITLQLGYYKGNIIKINENDVVLNENLKNREGAQTISFIFE
jgi:cytoskeletal protein RodZ